MTPTEYAHVPIRATRAVYSGGGAALAAWVLLGADFGGHAALAVLVLVAGAYLVARSLRIGLAVGPDAVVVRNLFKTYQVPYADVQLVDALGTVDLARNRLGVNLWRLPCVRVVRRSGGEVAATGAAGGLAEPAVDAIRAAAG